MNDGLEPKKLIVGRVRTERWVAPALAGVVLAVLVLGWAWWGTRAELADLRESVAKQVREAAAESRDSRTIAKDTQETLRDTQAKVATLEAKLAESQTHQVALEGLFQDLARSRDQWLLAEVEQTLAIAAQQLQIAGNVPAALVALQNSDAQLARSDRPQFLPLRRVIARDIDRLRAAPALDITGMTLRIDQVIAAVDQLPLLADGRPPAAGASSAAEADERRKESAWRSVWDELKGLVRIQRLDAADPSLLAPESRYFVRENLKLRLLHARLALLQRDEAAFRNDIRSVQSVLGRYFDGRQKSVSAASATLAQLAAAAVNVELPTIADSLNAVRNLKLPPGKTVP